MIKTNTFRPRQTSILRPPFQTMIESKLRLLLTIWQRLTLQIRLRLMEQLSWLNLSRVKYSWVEFSWVEYSRVEFSWVWRGKVEVDKDGVGWTEVDCFVGLSRVKQCLKKTHAWIILYQLHSSLKSINNCHNYAWPYNSDICKEFLYSVLYISLWIE